MLLYPSITETFSYGLKIFVWIVSSFKFQPFTCPFKVIYSSDRSAIVAYRVINGRLSFLITVIKNKNSNLDVNFFITINDTYVVRLQQLQNTRNSDVIYELIDRNSNISSNTWTSADPNRLCNPRCNSKELQVSNITSADSISSVE